MSSIKITLLAVIVFAAPLALTVAYQLSTSEVSVNESPPLIGKVLFFSSPS